VREAERNNLVKKKKRERERTKKERKREREINDIFIEATKVAKSFGIGPYRGSSNSFHNVIKHLM
jgi:hypothetical protein